MVAVREATPEDAHAISVIGRTAMPVQFAGLVDAEVVQAVATQTYEPSAVAECIRRCNAADDALFLVAEIEGQVVGYLHFDPFDGDPELHRIYIGAEYRSRGVGAALVAELHERLRPRRTSCSSSRETPVPFGSTSDSAFAMRRRSTGYSTIAPPASSSRRILSRSS